ncbi:hypothetical protein [Streptomyces albus]|uniref:hypothetical protein n=1 Tax=Streptomyces albus TaxID=1888 RepID=UPI0024E100B9|nr:hypothetical protein [Streptomyces albus]GHJ18471.1 hypothetical protein TPA0909_00850 [Streptomyces albus]
MPLKLTDTRYLIPEQAGWPKFFVTDSRSNRKGQGRWLFVFQRDRADGPWKAAYLSVVDPDAMPEFARDAEGHVKAVPVGGASGLTVAPDQLQPALHPLSPGGRGRRLRHRPAHPACSASSG